MATKKGFRHNTIHLDSQKAIFPVKDYESLFYLVTNIPSLLGPSKKETFMRLFNEYINKYTEEEPSKQLFNSCYGENSVKINNHVVSHFQARLYNGIAAMENRRNNYEFR